MSTKAELKHQIEELSRSLWQAEAEQDEALEWTERADLRSEELQGENERQQKKLKEALKSHKATGKGEESTHGNEKS